MSSTHFEQTRSTLHSRLRRGVRPSLPRLQHYPSLPNLSLSTNTVATTSPRCPLSRLPQAFVDPAMSLPTPSSPNSTQGLSPSASAMRSSSPGPQRNGAASTESRPTTPTSSRRNTSFETITSDSSLESAHGANDHGSRFLLFHLLETLRHVKSDQLLAFVSALAGDRFMDANALQTRVRALAVPATTVCQSEGDETTSDGGDAHVKGVHLCRRHGQRVAIVAFWNWQDARRVKEIFDARLTGSMMRCEQVAADELTKPTPGLDPIPDAFVDEVDGRFYLTAIPPSAAQAAGGGFEQATLAKLLSEHGQLSTFRFEKSAGGHEVCLVDYNDARISKKAMCDMAANHSSRFRVQSFRSARVVKEGHSQGEAAPTSILADPPSTPVTALGAVPFPTARGKDPERGDIAHTAKKAATLPFEPMGKVRPRSVSAGHPDSAPNSAHPSSATTFVDGSIGTHDSPQMSAISQELYNTRRPSNSALFDATGPRRPRNRSIDVRAGDDGGQIGREDIVPETVTGTSPAYFHDTYPQLPAENPDAPPEEIMLYSTQQQYQPLYEPFYPLSPHYPPQPSLRFGFGSPPPFIHGYPADPLGFTARPIMPDPHYTLPPPMQMLGLYHHSERIHQGPFVPYMATGPMHIGERPRFGPYANHFGLPHHYLPQPVPIVVPVPEQISVHARPPPPPGRHHSLNSNVAQHLQAPFESTGDRNQFNLERAERGQDMRTTVMIKNIPNKMSDKELEAIIAAIVPRRIDFIYLRMDFKNACNVGYAFVNFIKVEDLVTFAKAKLGVRWNMFSSEKELQMSYATYQGKEAQVEKFKNSAIMDERPGWRPRIFYSDGPDQGLPEEFPSPTHLRRKERSSHNRGMLFTPGPGSSVGGSGGPRGRHHLDNVAGPSSMPFVGGARRPPAPVFRSGR